ncbi:MAG: YbaB/EbfC family nucleoid-associated protein [Flavobacteriales bacterium]|nr:YbaB/EbfC family nucleoid-associated protein [Flavobacteriales bacterium]
MFGLDKLKDFKKNAEEAKARLDSITVDGVAGSNLVTVTCTASKKVVNIDISETVLRTATKQDAEKLILEAINNAMLQADRVAESEMRSILPNIPGL